MSTAIYDKNGRYSFREKKLVNEIKKALIEKFGDEEKALSNFSPARTFDELQTLHREYCSQVVEFEEVKEGKINEKEPTHEEFRDSLKKTIVEEKKMDSVFTDPFNQSNPMVRDYVMEEKFDSGSSNSEPRKSSFEEPTTFKDAFKMPEVESGSSSKSDSKKPEREPINPSYNEQSSGRKKRTNKKFAKYIVEAVCMLAEKGFIWWTTKDITEAKIAQYELNNEIDLSVLLTMPDGQQATVKDWFKSQELTAEALSKFESSEKEDLAEVLAELLDKKGVSPSIEQEVAIIALKMFGQKVMVAMEMKRGVNSILEQLRAMNTPTQKTAYQEPKYDDAPPPSPQPQETVSNFAEAQNTVVQEIRDNFPDIEEAKLIE